MTLEEGQSMTLDLPARRAATSSTSTSTLGLHRRRHRQPRQTARAPGAAPVRQPGRPTPDRAAVVVVRRRSVRPDRPANRRPRHLHRHGHRARCPRARARGPGRQCLPPRVHREPGHEGLPVGRAQHRSGRAAPRPVRRRRRPRRGRRRAARPPGPRGRPPPRLDPRREAPRLRRRRGVHPGAGPVGGDPARSDRRDRRRQPLGLPDPRAGGGAADRARRPERAPGRVRPPHAGPALPLRRGGPRRGGSG